MDYYKQTLILIDSNKFVLEEMVQLFELLENKLEIDTVSGMARSENKSHNGIKKSNRYYKTKVGGQTMVVKGLGDSKLPF